MALVSLKEGYEWMNIIFLKSENENKRPALPLHFFFKLGFTPCKAEQPLQGVKLQEKETQKD